MAHMNTFEGQQELNKYLKENSKPTFTNFINAYKSQIATWSVAFSSIDPSALYSIWSRRFKESTNQIHPEKRPHSRYNPLQWVEISSMATRRKNTKQALTEDAIELLGQASSSARQIMHDVFNGENSSRHTLPDDRGVSNKYDNQDVEGLFSFAFKKLKGQSLSRQEIEIIKAYTRNDGTIRSKLTKLASTYLLQDRLSSVEAELLMLLLTGVINTLDPYIENIMQSILTRSEISSLSRSIDLDGSGLSPTSVELLKDLVNNAENANNLLASISIQKSTSLQKGRQSDLYKALSILELAVLYLDLPLTKEASEQTCYRHFAVLLDILLSGSGILIKDGEVISQATKEAMEASEYQETDGMFGRKIDMILKVESTLVELSTNEWKSMQTSDLKLTQQSKNIRSNCAILNKLQIDLGNDEQILALDMTGDVGYIYRLQKMDDVYLASLFTSVFLPSDICQMDLFVETIVALFKWKHFMVTQSKRLKVQLAKNNMDNTAGPSVRPLSPVMPKVFFGPRRASMKRPHGGVDE
ncbi:hypothetical protein INT47_006860 [Mucor saturninus]|uniref:Uncharacterized protein n=1 Tax=Mucor saturninus TaxID=64648 RepID=A0A8H7RBD3_9FUNG|nr:hypothetical protein INT47_006860 [Mucor saturninus]